EGPGTDGTRPLARGAGRSPARRGAQQHGDEYAGPAQGVAGRWASAMYRRGQCRALAVLRATLRAHGHVVAADDAGSAAYAGSAALRGVRRRAAQGAAPAAQGRTDIVFDLLINNLTKREN